MGASQFAAVMNDPLPLPDYAGSLLRGAFGAALRRVACMTGLRVCDACPLYRTCPYPAIFETPPRATPLRQEFSRVPNPYVVEPPPPGRRIVPPGAELAFHMVLIGGETLRQLPLIVHSWQRALAHGLGTTRAQSQLIAVEWCGDDGTREHVLDAATSRVLAHEASLDVPAPPSGVAAARLQIHTPLRLQRQGRALGPRELDVRTLAHAAVRRATLMLHLHAVNDVHEQAKSVLETVERIQDRREGLVWFDWTRYSSRQKQEMTLGGVTGFWDLRGEVASLWPWLWLAQWLHLGKNATMGLGQVRLESIP